LLLAHAPYKVPNRHISLTSLGRKVLIGHFFGLLYTFLNLKLSMKTKTLLLIATALVVLTFGVTAKAGNVAPYGRVGIDYTKFHSSHPPPEYLEDDNFSSWKIGPVIEGGVVLNYVHSLGIEVSYVEDKYSLGVFNFKKQQVPVLLAYRYTHAFTNKFSIYGGVTAGVMMDKYSIDTTSATTSGSATNWIPAAGVLVGVNWSFGGSWYITAGARLLQIWQKAYKNIGTGGYIGLDGNFHPSAPYTFGRDSSYMRPTFILGLGYKWFFPDLCGYELKSS